MPATDIDPNLPQPFGAQQRRSATPLNLLAGIFFGWFAFLVVLAVTATHR